MTHSTSSTAPNFTITLRPAATGSHERRSVMRRQTQSNAVVDRTPVPVFHVRPTPRAKNEAGNAVQRFLPPFDSLVSAELSANAEYPSNRAYYNAGTRPEFSTWRRCYSRNVQSGVEMKLGDAGIYRLNNNTLAFDTWTSSATDVP
ncbi:hypothetical protein PG994_011998 [Apiospora phragmitis]|uniref:Uncharacterized protein n=1 Tax=Apiospora phragmitis TaxID=2905665 RepID=A0ABR1TWZ6_9PEZI